MNEDISELQKENNKLKELLYEANQALDSIHNGELDSIVSLEHTYQHFIDNMTESAIMLSKDGIILYANSGFYKMIGYSGGKLIGSSFINYIHEDSKDVFFESLKAPNKTKHQINIISESNQIIQIMFIVAPMGLEKSENICLIASNITKLKRAQKMIDTSAAVAKILSENTEFTVAFQLIINSLKNYLNWDVLVLWIYNEVTKLFSCMEIVHVSDLKIDEFAEKTRGITGNRETIFNQVLSYFRPIWIEDVVEEAVKIALEFQPDLMLLDVMMPKMDGIATLQAIKLLPSLVNTPVIFITARSQKDEIESYRKQGVLDVITKPFDPSTFAQNLIKICSKLPSV